MSLHKICKFIGMTHKFALKFKNSPLLTEKCHQKTRKSAEFSVNLVYNKLHVSLYDVPLK